MQNLVLKEAPKLLRNIHRSLGDSCLISRSNLKEYLTKVSSAKDFVSGDSVLKWGTDSYSKWVSELSSDEVRALGRYTYATSTVINSALRNLRSFDKNNIYANEIKHITSALQFVSVPEDILCYRGMPKEALGIYKDLPIGNLAGKIIYDTGFSSTSALLEVAQGRDYDIVMNILIPKGAKGAYLGNINYYDGEHEILMDMGQAYLIHSAKLNDKMERGTFSKQRLILDCEIIPERYEEKRKKIRDKYGI